MQTGVQSVEFTIIRLDSPDAILDFSESTPVCLSHAERVAQLHAEIDYNYPACAQTRGRTSSLKAAVMIIIQP